ncbi:MULTISPECIES: thiolase family protein [unclassified Roseibium]|uniref:thiolase family protein n=1 Tax=unclassified Roseibium TaxID=2629323 RepID=UPI00273CFCCF|nr:MULTISPECIES: thiolase family protein [unclassified Roseibium]
MTRRAVIAAARRTPVAPRGGGLKDLQADELAAPVFTKLLEDTGIPDDMVDYVLLGNALYAGGNPARMAALRAGLPATIPAMTIDTQCCSGLDAIVHGARLIEAGAARCVIAGGAESWTRAPVRMHRPKAAGAEPVAYSRPAFAPPPFDDPDLSEAAARLAARLEIGREDQTAFAVHSHEKARAAKTSKKRVVCPGTDLVDDSFTRPLSIRAAMRAPVLYGDRETGLSAATIACEADGAAGVLIMSEDLASERGISGLTVIKAGSMGGDPADPALVPIEMARQLLNQATFSVADMTVVELHEAYAVQAIAAADTLGIPHDNLNPLGGGLARGHPIGASGAVLMVQLHDHWHTPRTQGSPQKFTAMALIAAAGGLAAGVMVEAFEA